MYIQKKIVFALITLGLVLMAGSAMAQTAPVVSGIPDQTIAEGATFTTINLDDYVTDAENTPAEMTWTYTGDVDLTVSIDVNRVATITTPGADWNGEETITFRATDPDLLFAEDAATFTVTAVNDAPVVTDIPDQAIAEGASFATFDLDDFVTDVDNTPTEMTWTYSGNTDLTVSIDVDNVVTIGIPTTDWNGSEAITFRATDPGTLFAEDAATFTVTAVNDAPVVTDIPDQTIAEGASFTTIDLDAYVSDLDNTDAEMTWTYSGNTDLTVAIDGSNIATISIPSAEWNGDETITFRATDPGTLFDEDVATFTVTAVNDAPVVTDIPDQTIAEGASFTTFDLDDFVSDIDNTDAEMTWTYSGNTELTVSIDAGNVVTIGIPSAEWNNAETITFRATDPGTLFAEDAATFTVTAVNDAPVVTDIPDQTIAEGATFATIDLDDFVSDIDNTDAEMTWTYSGNTDLTVAIDGSNIATISIPSAEWNGDETITFRATDPGTLFAEDAATFTVTAVNDAPVVTDIPDQTIAEGASFVTISLDDYVSDLDNTDAEMTWTYSGNTDLTVAIDGSNIATISIPSAEWNNAETITFRATDPGTLFAEDAATFTVTAVNDAPVVTDIPDQTVAEGATFATIDLDAYVSDLDNTDAEMTWTYSGNTELTVAIDGSNIATISIPSADWNGSEAITFRATDPGTLFAEDAATFTVTAVNDAPVVTDIPDQTIAEGASFTTFDLDDFVSDIDNTDAEMTWTYSGNTELTVSIDAGNVVTIGIPSAEWNNAETITFRATDPGTLFAEDAATFNVTAVNDAPVVTDIPDQTIAEGASFVTISLDDYVSDLDNTDAEMTWTYSGNTDLNIVIDASNIVTIGIPSINWNGSEAITFRATDPGTLFAEDVATFTVTGVNDQPIVTNIPDQTVFEGNSFTSFDLDDFVSDVDNADADLTWTYNGNTELTISIDASNIVTIGIPSPDWNGSETVTFRATDPGTLFSEDVATFTVTGVGDAPVVTDIPDQTIAEGATFATINLDDFVSDIDNTDAEMTWTYFGNSDLTVSIDGSRVATITIPDADWNGVEAITFRATDPGMLFDEDVATFTVMAVNDAPVVTDIPDQTVAEGASFATIDLNAYVSDIDNIDAEMTWIYSGNTELTVAIDGSNIATITTPDADWNGAEAITFRATDPGTLFAEDAATFTVTAVNDAPVVAGIPDQTIAEGATFATIDLATYVSDIDNTPAEMTWTYGGNVELTVAIDGSNIATITTPSGEWNGAETITFRATDPGTLFGEDAATFTVTAVGDAPVVTDIPDQTIAEGASFVTISLDDYVSDIDNTDAEMTWTYAGNTELTVAIDGSNVATITIPDADWNGTETITFRATDPTALFAEDAATFTVTAVNDAPVVDDIPDQTVAEGATFVMFDLDDYVSDIDNVDADITWMYAGNTQLLVSIDASNVATITIPNGDWNGSETVTFRATDPGTLFDEDAATFTVTAVNDAPVVAGIPDQTIAEGATFATIALDDYVSDIDNTDAEMTWTYTGNTELTVAIDGSNIATITTPSGEWNGVETITFRATDPGTEFGEDAATFTVTGVGDAPVATDIPDQTIAESATFATIALDDYVSDIDNTDAEMTWTYTGNTELTVAIDGSRIATITIPDADWNGAETITFRATDPTALFAEDAATFTVTAVNDAPVVTDIPDQTIAEGASFATIDLNGYVSDIDNLDAEMTWTYSGNVELTIAIDGSNIATITVPSGEWNGAETITFRAADPDLLFAEDAATFTVTAVGDAPVVADIPDQTIAEGASFVTISLDDYVSDIDNTDAEMTWTYAGNTELTVAIDGANIATITIPDADWNGAEAITFRATDPGLLFGEDAATFTVTAVNDVPVMTDIPDQTIAEGATFATIALDDYVSDIDNTDAEMSWTYSGNTELTVAIDGSNIATITAPDADWNGAEMITFRATDPGLLFAEDLATFTVTAVNDAPVVADIPDQAVAEGATFATIALDDYVSDIDNTDAEMTWTYSGNIELTVAIDGSNIATVSLPTGDWNGSETVTFRATDPGTLFGEDAATFTVSADNDSPVVSDIPDQTIDEGAAFTTINLDDYVTDVDNTVDQMTWTYSGNTDLTVTIDGSRVATITIPDADWNGAEAITFRATDPGLLFAEDAATFTVNPLNDPPVLDPIGPQTVGEGGNLNFTVTASDIDGTTPVLSTSTPLPANATFDGATGIFDFNPDYTQEGSYEVTFYADDGTETDFEIVTISVVTTNQPPVLDPIGPQTVLEGATLNFTVTATDADGTTPILSTTTPLPTNATFDAGTGVFTFTPDFTQSGAYDVTFYADDGMEMDSEIVTITVTEEGNQAPVIDPIGAQIVYENSNLNLTITASDPDGETPTLSAEGVPTNATFDTGTGVFDFSPDFTQAGDFNVIFKAFDGILVDSEVVTITVLNTNQVPVLDPITSPQTTAEGGNLTFTISGSDPDGTIPGFTASPLPANATVTDNLDGTGTFSFDPAFDQAGSYDIWFFATDGIDADSQIVTVTVADGGNQAPVLTTIGPLFVMEGTTLNATITAIDPDGTTPTLTAINLPANSTFLDNLDGTGTFNFTPDFTQAGVYGVTFITSDGVLADSEFVLVSVTELGNQAPVLDPIATPLVVNENDTLTIALSGSDIDGDSVFFSYTSRYPMTGITIEDNYDGTATFVYMPDFQSSGVDTVRVYITDDGSPQLSDVQLVEIITLDVNQPPTIEPIGPFGIRAGRTLQFTVTASDTTSSGDGQVYLTASGLPVGATFVDQGDNTGQFTFTPTTAQAGIYTVRFIVVDDDEPPMSSRLDVQITVVATNAAPEFAAMNPQMVIEGTTLDFTVTATDADGPIPTLTAERIPENAFFVDNLDGTGSFSFSPTFVQSGLYGIDFRATDGIDVTKMTVLIQVIDAGNQTPDIGTVSEQTVIEAGVLTFTISASDPDGTTPTFTAENMPNGAELVDNGDGSATFVWTPGYTQAGIYDVTIIASDGELTAATIVTITVDDAGNQTPTISAINPITVNENATIQFTVMAADLDSVVPVLTIPSLPGGATFVDNGDYTGSFQWVTTSDDDGEFDVEIFATDGDDAGLSVSTVVHLTINDINRMPYLLEIPPGQTKSVNEGSVLVYTLSGFDPDGTPPLMRMDTTITNFDFVDNGDGTAALTISPSYLQAGLYAITFLAFDADTVRYPDDSGTFGPINFTIRNMAVAPILEPIGPQSVIEGGQLEIAIYASNPGGGTPDILVEDVPVNAGLVFGTTMPRYFRFAPDYTQSGSYDVRFIATQNGLTDFEVVTITVEEAGNQYPEFVTPSDTQTVILGESLVYHIVAEDPDADALIMTLINPPANVVFVDSGNGAASAIFTPDASQNGATQIFRFVTTDALGQADTLFKWARVTTFLRGDSNDDGTVNVADVLYIINYVFREGPEPAIMDAADVNNDGIDEPLVNVGDALYLINFIFRQGPPPIEN